MDDYFTHWGILSSHIGPMGRYFYLFPSIFPTAIILTITFFSREPLPLIYHIQHLHIHFKLNLRDIQKTSNQVNIQSLNSQSVKNIIRINALWYKLGFYHCTCFCIWSLRKFEKQSGIYSDWEEFSKIVEKLDESKTLIIFRVFH